MEKVKVGMIGAGGLANAVHYPSLAEFNDVEISAICDLDTNRLKNTAEKYKIEKTYTDYKKMIKEVDLDAVYIIMPPHHLFDLVIQCLNSKLNVFIEKPPGVTSEQTRNMAITAEKNGCLTMVGFNRRFIPLLVEAKKRVLERGEMIQCVATFYKNSIGAGPYYAGAIDILTCDAIHAVDALRWMGGEVVSVASDIRSIYAEYDNSFNALMRFENGGTGILLTNWVVGKRVHTFEMHAKGISAFVNGDDNAFIYSDNKEEPLVLKAKEVAGSSENYKYYGFYNENRHFIDCIKQGKMPETNFADAFKTMELVNHIYRSQI
ncbi:TPA: Gfo/Idh/MocA family oxidoreductase [Candidatus Poribacteria bacterium]|nr:Gfo/Idh/MocA family oxidoreductase [Candidatus Poribacteria bacterium]